MGPGRRLALLLAAVVAPAAACTAVLGVSDLHGVGDAGPDGTLPDAGGDAAPAADGAGSDVGEGAALDATGAEADASAPEGGPLQDAGADGAGDGGATGDAGHDAGPEAGSEAGPDAGPDAPVGCTVRQLNQSKLTDVTRACVMLFGCSPSGSSVAPSLSACIDLDYPEATVKDTCALGALDCNTLSACTGTANPGPSDCPDAGEYCHGNRAAHCSGPDAGEVDLCTFLGGQCAVYDHGGTPTAGCNVAPSCTQTDGLPHCVGNTLFTCADAGLGMGLNCPTGTTCATHGSTTACFPNLPACTTGPGWSCFNGQDQLLCTAAGEVDFPCTALGSGCALVGFSSLCLTPGCTSNDVKGCVESCAGTTANVCVGGASLAIDCSAYGFGQCVTYGAKSQNVKCAP